ncbi:HEPN domain-containing protein [Candidatus Woesearchaeota archaeon]|nr:HEPN domain-containing protein [Candidatus Woesearchaeota archaeon]
MMEAPDEWMNRAERDLKTANANLGVGEHEAAAFFSHQAAEKALKALYIKRHNKLWKTHDLVGLISKLGHGGIENECELLNRHYIDTRYVVDLEYSREIAESALKLAGKVVKWSRQKLKGED